MMTRLKVEMTAKKTLTKLHLEELEHVLLDHANDETLTTDERERLAHALRGGIPHGLLIAFEAVRNCYSPHSPDRILEAEFRRYFLSASRNAELGGGTEAERLLRFIYQSKHTSTLEHVEFTFNIGGVSRALLAQLTRHRHWSFSVKSQRYVKLSSDSRSGGMDYVLPDVVIQKGMREEYTAFMEHAQHVYDGLVKAGVSQEDARFVLPNAASTDIVASLNLSSALDFYRKRRKGKGAQWEIAELAERVREEIVLEEPWTAYFFDKMDQE